MLRILFIENCKNTKTNNFKVLDTGEMILGIVKLKIWLMVNQLMEVRYLLYNYFESTNNNYRGSEFER